MTRFGTTVTVSAFVVFFCASQTLGGIIWYTAEADNSRGWSHLFSVDTASGEIEDRGELHGLRYVTDLAMDQDGALYGVGWTNGHANGTSKLYRFTPGDETTRADWDIVKIKSNKMERSVNAAVLKDGDLYIASAQGKIQKLSYEARHDRWNVVKTASLGYRSSGDLAFDATGETLYITLAGGSLGTVNFDTSSKNFGNVNVLGNSGYGELFGLAMVDNSLYATTNGPGNYEPSYLVQLGFTEGEASNPLFLDQFVWGAVEQTSLIPEPTTTVVLALGGWLALIRRRRMVA